MKAEPDSNYMHMIHPSVVKDYIYIYIYIYNYINPKEFRGQTVSRLK